MIERIRVTRRHQGGPLWLAAVQTLNVMLDRWVHDRYAARRLRRDTRLLR